MRYSVDDMSPAGIYRVEIHVFARSLTIVGIVLEMYDSRDLEQSSLVYSIIADGSHGFGTVTHYFEVALASGDY